MAEKSLKNSGWNPQNSGFWKSCNYQVIRKVDKKKFENLYQACFFKSRKSRTSLRYNLHTRKLAEVDEDVWLSFFNSALVILKGAVIRGSVRSLPESRRKTPESKVTLSSQLLLPCANEGSLVNVWGKASFGTPARRSWLKLKGDVQQRVVYCTINSWFLNLYPQKYFSI